MLKNFFLCFVIFSSSFFCFAKNDDIFYESENDRVLQIIENERMKEEMYAKKQEEKRLKKLKKLEEKERKKLLKSANRDKTSTDDLNYKNKSYQNSNTSFDDVENLDVLAFDYVKNKQKNDNKKDENLGNNFEKQNIVSSQIENNVSNSVPKPKNEETFKDFKIVTKGSNDNSRPVVILQGSNLKEIHFDKSHKNINKNSKKSFNNNKARTLRKQKFEFNKNLKPVYFKNDSSYISNNYKKVLDSNVFWLKKNSLYKVLIIGHTDRLGKTEYNIKLGQDRANSVRKYFIQSGIQTSRIQTISYGDFKSKNERADADRKVEILIYK